MNKLAVENPSLFLKLFSDDPKLNIEGKQEIDDIVELMKTGRITGPDQYYKQKSEQEEQKKGGEGVRYSTAKTLS